MSWGTSAVYDGARYTYVFGGNQCFGTTAACQANCPGPPTSSWGREIYRFDRILNATELIGLTPTPTIGATTVWVGDAAYIFGGWTFYCGWQTHLNTNWGNKVYRFVPGQGVTQVATLPKPLPAGAAVWDGHHVHILSGGYACVEYGMYDTWCPDPQVLRFDPATNTLTVAGQTPRPYYRVMAEWTGTHATVVGIGSAYFEDSPAPGFACSAVNMAACLQGNDTYAEAYRFDPPGLWTPLNVSVPLVGWWHGGLWGGSVGWAWGNQAVAWDGRHMLVFAGNRTWALDPQAETLESRYVHPTTIFTASVAFDGCYVQLFHANLTSLTSLRQVWRFGPSTPCLIHAGLTLEEESRDCIAATFRYRDRSAPRSAPVAWRWSFDGEEVDGGPEMVRTFTAGGEHVVSLTVTDASGTAVTASQPYTVRLEWYCPPRIDPVPPLEVAVGTPLRICLTGAAGRGGTLDFWVVGSPTGSAFDPAGPCLEWTPGPTQAGIYPCLRAGVSESPSGLSDATCIRVVVRAGPLRHGPVDDTDQDGVADPADNCLRHPNPKQEDTDRDGEGDACDPPRCLEQECVRAEAAGHDAIVFLRDADADMVPDVHDLCPHHADVLQADLDGDTQGDACDADDDGDGIHDLHDNCPRAPNPTQADADGDGQGDACAARASSTLGAPAQKASDRPMSVAPAGHAVAAPVLLVLLVLVLLAGRTFARKPRR